MTLLSVIGGERSSPCLRGGKERRKEGLKRARDLWWRVAYEIGC